MTEAFGKLSIPVQHQRIRVHFKNGDIMTGRVNHVWHDGVTTLVTFWSHGGQHQFWPGLGDSWEPAE